METNYDGQAAQAHSPGGICASTGVFHAPVIDEENCQRRLQAHLDRIIGRVRESCSSVRSIILYGGYGRNEGSWYLDDEGRVCPYNDYDLLVISEGQGQLEDCAAMRRQLASEIGIRWMDIATLSVNKLSGLRPTIFSYDLKYASTVVYGDQDVVRLIPDMHAESLSMKESEQLFFTRLWTLLGCLDEEGLSIDRNGDESRFFRNQMAKAVLAVVDVLLLHQKAYTPSYVARVDRVAELYSEKNDLIDLCRWALAEKLRPQAAPMTSRNMAELYEQVHSYFLTEMYAALSVHYGIKIQHPSDIERCIKYNPMNTIKRIGWFAKYRGFRMERQIAINLAQVYLAAAWSPDGIDAALMQRGNDLVARSSQQSRPMAGPSWDQSRVNVSLARMTLSR
jgi:hypothetical protein